MYIDLSGTWNISLKADEGIQSGSIVLPGILQACGYGNPIGRQTPWVSSLHDPLWYEREEYQYGQEEGVNVPFLSQPPRHFLGQAVYERSFVVTEEMGCQEGWHFYVERTRWRSQVWIDEDEKGEDCSLCTPHDIPVGKLDPGRHTIKVVLDNSMLYPYRPDAHSISDALGGSWNGMLGEIALFTEGCYEERRHERRIYARNHPRIVAVEGNRVFLDGVPFYFRATHFGGDFPLTGTSSTDKGWWKGIMTTIKKWGLNGIRFHSYCPPEAAFAAADEENVCLLVECGMWNTFDEGEKGAVMYGLLKEESERILDSFGHHPSFVFFSSSNEPGGAWYQPLRRWVGETRKYDESLGYEGRRLYTAQSGWFYDVPPAEIEGTDFIYFHRSGYGPYPGGTIRNPAGWKGGNYSPSLEGVKKPVYCHELGQICAYPDYSVIDKFTGYLQPGNYKVFRENARANGILPYAADFVKCSGENQVRLYKEELEANFRTPQIQGFELLDLHDYLGQGTALVGILDPFWESKGYGSPDEFRAFCGDTVLLAACSSYVWKSVDTAVIPVEICHYGKEEVPNGVVCWRLGWDGEQIRHEERVAKQGDSDICGEQILRKGELPVVEIFQGGNTKAGNIVLDFGEIMGELSPVDTQNASSRSRILRLTLELLSPDRHRVWTSNNWNLYVFENQLPPGEICKDDVAGGLDRAKDYGVTEEAVLYTREWSKARAALKAGGRVVFSPYLSDLNYECPALSARSVNWNSQMGPSWCRTMGLVVDTDHPIFRSFATGHSGGWQWEEILEHARGFHMEGLEQVKPIVQPIDDWNRNLLQALIFEARVLNGKLLLVSASLEGTFEKRPEAFCLKQAILGYAASGEFAPATEADPAAIERKLFPLLRMNALTKDISYTVKSRYGDGIVKADPNRSAWLEGEKFPISATIMLKRPVVMQGVVYLPEQRTGVREGLVREYMIEVLDPVAGCWEKAATGTFRNSSRSQSVYFHREMEGSGIRLTVYSAYGCVDKQAWRWTEEGWYRLLSPERAVARIAGLHIICGEEAPHGDSFAGEDGRSLTKEIDL